MLLMWVIGIGAEIVLITGLAVYGRLTESPRERALRRHAEQSIARLQAYDDSVARGLKPPPPEITAAQKAALRAILRDSLGITWETHGSVTTFKGPPGVDSLVRRAAIGVASLERAVLLGAVMFLTIPLALVVLTVAWLLLRRWPQRTTLAAPGV